MLFYKWFMDGRTDHDMNSRSFEFPEHFVEFDDKDDWLDDLEMLAYKSTCTIHRTNDAGVSIKPRSRVLKAFLNDLMITSLITEAIGDFYQDIGYFQDDPGPSKHWKKYILYLFNKYHFLGHLDEVIKFLDTFRRKDEYGEYDKWKDKSGKTWGYDTPSFRTYLKTKDELKEGEESVFDSRFTEFWKVHAEKMIAVLERDGKPTALIFSDQYLEIQFWRGPVFSVEGGNRDLKDPNFFSMDRYLDVEKVRDAAPDLDKVDEAVKFLPVTIRPFNWDSKEDLQLLEDHKKRKAELKKKRAEAKKIVTKRKSKEAGVKLVPAKKKPVPKKTTTKTKKAPAKKKTTASKTRKTVK